MNVDNQSENSLHEDIAAAFKSASTDGQQSAGNESSAAPAAGAAAPVPNQQQESGGNRGPDGRFVSSGTGNGAAATEGATAVPANGQVPAQAAAGTQPPAGNGNAGTDGTNDGGLKLDPAKPPSGWSQPMKEKWSTIPEDVRQEIIRREEAGIAGVHRLKQQYEPAEKLYGEVSKYKPYFEHIQTTPEEYFGNIIQVEQTLTLGNPAQKMEALLSIADDYGIPLRQTLDAAMGGQLANTMKQAHEQFKTPATLPPEVVRELQEARQFRENMAHQAFEQELKAITDDPATYPLFETVKDAMADLLEAGRVSTYKEAYEFAVWQNPEWRAKAQAIANGQQQQDALRQRQQAAAAIATPAPGAVTGMPAAGEDESTEDAVRRAWAASGRAPGTI